MSARAILVAAIAAPLAAAPAFGATIQTFSFEQPALAAGSYFYDPPGTPGVTYNGIPGPTGGGGSGIISNGSAFGFPNAPDGTQAAFIQNANGTFGQITLSLTGLVAGASYDATFYTVARPGYPTDPLVVTFDATPVGSYLDTSAAFALQTTSVFVATGGADTLTFTGQAIPANGGNVALDLVSIVSVPIPEPATLALVFVGLVVTAGAGRRACRYAPIPLS